MRLTRRHRRWFAGGVGALGVLAALGLGAGPVARQFIRGAASQRGVTLEVGRLWPTWWGVRLLDARVRLAGVEGVEIDIPETRIELGALFGVRRVRIRGAAVAVHGPASRLAEELSAWRHRDPSASRTQASAASGPTVELTDGTISWWDSDSTPPRAEVLGVNATRNAEGLSFSADSLEASRGATDLRLRSATARLNREGILTSARAASLVVDWRGRRGPTPVASAWSATAADRTADASTPLLELPDLRAAHGVAAAAVQALALHLGDDAALQVDAVTWKVSLHDGSALTLGPGPLSVTRGPSRIETSFSTSSSDQSPSLTARLSVPLGDEDWSLDLQGGPVSLGALGIQEGATGLFDVLHTTVAGRAHLVLAADVRALTFDCEGAARGISIRDPLLASEDIRGLDVQLRARGSLSSPANLRLDELAATIGALHVDASGLLEQEPDHVSGAFRMAVPTTPCNTLLASIPTALLPVASEMTFRGTFGADARVAFDSRSPDDLDLDYEVRDRCAATGVPAFLARDAFLRPFTHRVYLPDGSTEDEETGPGTAGWTPLDQISPFMEVAVTTTEDGAFRSHHGFNRAAIRSSIIANLKARRFVRGASTITMQLAKNLVLTREKTLSRKLEEVILTDYFEDILSKDEILELYFNVVEFGPAVYGITAAADYYFGRMPRELNLAEAFFLATILPSPLRNAAVRDAGTLSDARMAVLHSLMRAARKRGLLSDAELAEGLGESISFWRGGDKPPPRPASPVRSRPDAPSFDHDTDSVPTDLDP